MAENPFSKGALAHIPSAYSSSLSDPSFLPFLPISPMYTQIRSPLWRMALPSSDPSSTSSFNPHLDIHAPRSLHFPVQAGVAAVSRAAGAMQFLPHKFALPSSAPQSASGVSAIPPQMPVSGLQLLAESPESSLLDPQTSPNSAQKLTSEIMPALRPRLIQAAAQTEAPLAPKRQQQQQQQVYPPPLSAHKDVVADRQLFFHTLTQFHAFFGNQLVIPKIDGKELDLHLAYCQVTARGGLEQVIKLKKWDTIILRFGLSTQAYGLNFFLRKHYSNLLHHYEQVYFFRREGLLVPPPVPLPSPNQSSAFQSSGRTAAAFGGSMEPLRKRKRKTIDPVEMLGDAGKKVGQAVSGAIDGKFEHGYLVTIHVGAQILRGILYHVPNIQKVTQSAAVNESLNATSVPPIYSDAQTVPHHKKRGRRLPKRDPLAPRINRSGYNFYFAEQRSLLKHLGSENAEITRIIGDAWQRMTDQERMPYLQRGQRDRERYRKEKQVYCEQNKAQHRRQEQAFQPNLSDSPHDGGHTAEGLEEEAKQDAGDYYVSFDATDIDGSDMNQLQNQIYAEYISGGRLNYSQGQTYSISINANEVQEPTDYRPERTTPPFNGNEQYSAGYQDLHKQTQLMSQDSSRFQGSVPYMQEVEVQTQYTAKLQGSSPYVHEGEGHTQDITANLQGCGRYVQEGDTQDTASFHRSVRYIQAEDEVNPKDTTKFQESVQYVQEGEAHINGTPKIQRSVRYVQEGEVHTKDTPNFQGSVRYVQQDEAHTQEAGEHAQEQMNNRHSNNNINEDQSHLVHTTNINCEEAEQAHQTQSYQNLSNNRSFFGQKQKPAAGSIDEHQHRYLIEQSAQNREEGNIYSRQSFS